MNTILMAKADNLISVYNELKKKYKWRANDVSLRFAAFIFALLDVPFNINKYDTVIKYIKKNTGIFSYYRSTLLYPMAAQLMCQFDNSEQSFLQMLEYVPVWIISSTLGHTNFFYLSAVGRLPYRQRLLYRYSF